MDQEFKIEGQCQGHKISILKNKKQGFLADLSRYWKGLQKGTTKINNIVIENYVCSIEGDSKMDQYFKSEGQEVSPFPAGDHKASTNRPA